MSRRPKRTALASASEDIVHPSVMGKRGNGDRGAIALAYRSGEVTRIAADVVHEKDHFEYSKGLCPKLEHVESEEEERGPITHVYAVANFRNGGYAFEVWPVAKVVSHAKKFSKSYEHKGSPWQTDFESMAKKTLIMAIWKYLPLSAELMLAGEQDGTIRRELGGIQDERDVIQIMPARIVEPDEDAPEMSADGDKAVADGELRLVEAPSAVSPEALRARVKSLLGGEGLDLTEAERAAFVKEASGREIGADLDGASPDELMRIADAADAALAKRDEVAR